MLSKIKRLKPRFWIFFPVIFLCLSTQLRAQNLPGTAVTTADVDQNAVALVELAAQQFPELFSNSSTWRLFDGFYFQYFAGSGIYLGVNQGNLYVLGGPFGDQAVNQGRVSDVLALLRNSSAPSVSFDDFTSASTLKDLLRYFQTLTIAYDTISAAIDLRTSVSLEAQGTENVGGTQAEKLIVTINGNNLTEPQIYQMWVDNEGVIIKLLQAGGIEFLMPSSNLIGSGLVSSMLLSLAAAESPVVQAAISEELASPSLTTKTTDGNIGGIAVKKLVIQVGTENTPAILFEISDFGSFSMTSKFESTFLGTTSSFELKDIVLR